MNQLDHRARNPLRATQPEQKPCRSNRSGIQKSLRILCPRSNSRLLWWGPRQLLDRRFGFDSWTTLDRFQLLQKQKRLPVPSGYQLVTLLLRLHQSCFVTQYPWWSKSQVHRGEVALRDLPEWDRILQSFLPPRQRSHRSTQFAD